MSVQFVMSDDELYGWSEAMDQTLWYDVWESHVAKHPEFLSWWLRVQEHVQSDQRGLFTDAYPALYPYFPISTACPEFAADPWGLSPYNGYWFG